MFKIALEPTFTIPIEIDLPGMKTRPVFEATFRRLSKSEYQKLMASSIAPAELVKQVMVGWKGVVDEAEREIPFSEGELDKLLEILPVADSVFLGFIASLNLALKKT